MGTILSIHAFITTWRTSKKSYIEPVQGIEVVHLCTENEYKNTPLAIGIPIHNYHLYNN